MKSPYASELQPNQVVTAVFLVQHKDVRQKKSGEPYLSLVVGDRTGDIDAKMWDNVAEVMDTFDRDDFVRVKGLLQIFQNRPQFTIHKMLRVADREVDFSDYFPSSSRDPNEMMAELRSIIAGIGNPHLRGLLEALFDNPEIASRYKMAPAAKGIHHAYLGGLIEHVLSLCTLCRMTAGHYKDIDLDLLLTGAMLHDIGKIYELSYDRSFGYSNEGQLIGHIHIAMRMIGEVLVHFPEFPPKLRILLDHMILSHHGELEFGSPKVPLFGEAMLLHHLDNLDSKMECVRATVEKDRSVTGCWTSYSNALERVLLKKDKFLEEESAETAAPKVEAVVPSVAPAPPARPAAPPPAPPPPPPRPSTNFADKLQNALRGGS